MTNNPVSPSGGHACDGPSVAAVTAHMTPRPTAGTRPTCLTRPTGSTRPTASILMPVYNQEEFLRTSLQSAQKQTLTDIEIVCVDDGSTDSSPAILREAAAHDPRIRVITQRNQGVSAARNTALAAARGKYIVFCDPDDVMDPRLLETAIRAMRTYHADLCSFRFRAISAQGRPLRSRYRHNRLPGHWRVQTRSLAQAHAHAQGPHARTPQPQGTQTKGTRPSPIFPTKTAACLLTPRQAVMEQYRGRIGGYLWAFVARRSVYERARVVFPVGRRIEDEARICQILGSARRIVRIPDVLYCYRLHPGSLLGTPDPALIADWFHAQRDRDRQVIARFPDLAGFVRRRHLDVLGSLDYESMRQSLVFGLRLDPDSQAQRIRSARKRATRKVRRTMRKPARPVRK